MLTFLNWRFQKQRNNSAKETPWAFSSTGKLPLRVTAWFYSHCWRWGGSEHNSNAKPTLILPLSKISHFYLLLIVCVCAYVTEREGWKGRSKKERETSGAHSHAIVLIKKFQGQVLGITLKSSGLCDNSRCLPAPSVPSFICILLSYYCSWAGRPTFVKECSVLLYQFNSEAQ